MNFDFTLRLKIFIIAVVIIVAGQLIYSYKNVQSFQNSYINTLRYKCENLGKYLKKDVEYVLDFGVPISKLIKLENTISDILLGVQELEYIEITDLKQNLLYYADHTKMERINKGSKNSRFFSHKEIEKIKNKNLSQNQTDIIIPLFYKKKNEKVGYINMRLSIDNINAKSKQILFDMITVIMTSLLFTFEFLTFFVSYSINRPLEKLAENLNTSTATLKPLPGENYLFFGEFRLIIEKFNSLIYRYKKKAGPPMAMKQVLPELKKSFKTIIDKLKKKSKAKSGLNDSLAAKRDILISNIMNSLLKVETSFNDFQAKVSNFNVLPAKLKQDQPQNKNIKIPYSFIRPVVFLFIMADGFSISFFPLFVEELYTPILGLSKEIIIGIPISVFMLFLSLVMPFAGKITDYLGWYKPLITGLCLNSAGLFLTSLSKDITTLIIYRSITALGFGIVFISCQKFIIDNTDAKTRSIGMASFLAAFFSGDICGTVIGAMLAERIGYSSVFLVSGIFSFLTLFTAFLIFNDEIDAVITKKKKKTTFSFKEIFMVFKDKDFAFVLLLQAIPAKIILVGFLFYFTPLYLKKIETLQSDIGRIIMCYSIAIIFIGPLFSKYIDNENNRRFYILTGGLLTGFSLLTFHFYNNFYSILFIVSIIGVAQSLSVTSQASLVSQTDIVQKIGTGTGMGVFRFWERIGNVSGPILIGLLISFFGYRDAVVYTGVISITCSFIYMLFILTHKNKEE